MPKQRAVELNAVPDQPLAVIDHQPQVGGARQGAARVEDLPGAGDGGEEDVVREVGLAGADDPRREVVGTALRGFGPEIPYVTAWIDLDDGPRFCSNVIGCPLEEIYIDMPVEVVFEDSGDGITLPKFKPAA